MSTFSVCNYTIIVLSGYLMALIYSSDSLYYIFDAHARNHLGMPDENGTAVVLKAVNISKLEEYLRRLADCLNSKYF